MSLAHLAGQPVVESRGNRVVLAWDDEATQAVPASELVKSLCVELRAGITSEIVARLAGVLPGVASTYLTRLEQRGVLEVERVLRQPGVNGRPMRVFRVRGA